MTEELKIKVRKLISQGLRQKEIAEALSVCSSTVYYYSNDKNHASMIESKRKWRTKLSPEKKRELNKINKQNVVDWHNKKYATDLKFRENRKERSRVRYYLKKKEVKK